MVTVIMVVIDKCVEFVHHTRAKEEHNKSVKRRITEEISLSKENIYSKALIESKLNKAIHSEF